jgi:glutathione S-transferase
MDSKRFCIIVGNKSYSSWSLRAWLATKFACPGNDFEEMVLKLGGAGSDDPDIKRSLLQFSPTGKVPALLDRLTGITVYDSLAINLYLAELFPDSGLLPKSLAAKGICLSAAAEMHSGKYD